MRARSAHLTRPVAGIVAALIAVLLTPAIFTSTAQASAGSPCPSWSILDVLEDLNGDWDRDRVTNSDEVYVAGLNPCLADATTYCTRYPDGCLPPYKKVVDPVCPHPHHLAARIFGAPNADWDGDGLSNWLEWRNGANPCRKPCPKPTAADVRLDPNGAWDGDNQTNAVEWRRGTDPCDGAEYNPCPVWERYQIDLMPRLDWDNDGQNNRAELAAGTNPCVPGRPGRITTSAPGVVQQPAVTYTPRPTRTPAAQPASVPPVFCPAGYPYFHADNGKCYANPIGRSR